MDITTPGTATRAGTTRSAATQPATPSARAMQTETPNESDLHHMIEEAAYFRAEQRGFEAGHELEDWIEAEQNLRQRLFGDDRKLDA